MIERFHTNARMSRIVRHNGTVYLCGQVGEGETVTEQTRDCLSRVDSLLTEAGSTRRDILAATIWLAHMSDYPAMNEVWDDWIPAGCAPARACAEARLAGSDLLVEVIVTAAVST
ncbi:RidA family protein [Paracoccus jeotgali]|uniref:RidA family protein n=1 Tax=Paracoccus jeotgali TaxID=2065379 RepID=A0A2K9MJK7_9RHOB|nr:RidA family protein [Paracoccus jeotgali]AUM75821.1 hypothetical protein CYR75_15495 [Paracoccus jeotgali]